MSEQTEQDEKSEHEGPADDGFPAEDVSPDEKDPDMDVDDPFGVGEDREPLGDGTDENTEAAPESGDGTKSADGTESADGED